MRARNTAIAFAVAASMFACADAPDVETQEIPRSPAADAAPVQSEPIGTADGAMTSVPPSSGPVPTVPVTTSPAQAATQPVQDPLAATPRVTASEAKAAADAGALIVDVRSEQAYREGHIKGAINIPLDQFPQRIGELPTDRKIITYCT